MKIVRICVLICVFAILAQPPVRAQESAPAGSKEKGGRERMESLIREMFNQLNLTEGQKKQLEENKETHHKNMDALRKESRALRDSLNQLFMQPSLDMDTIHSLQSRMKDLESRKIDDRLNSILEVRSILTAGQFTKFIEFMNQHDQVARKKGPPQ